MSTITIHSMSHPISHPPQVRLTRRGRLAVLLAALTIVLAAALFLGATSVASEEAGTPEPTRVITVDTGETLWGIASDLTADGDIRTMMHRIERLNALETGMLAAGQKLRVPTRD